MNPEVSVIIINYNTYELTCQCIHSVLAKTQGVSYEIILVDNGSDEKITKPFDEMFPDVKYIKSKKNLGFAGGNNLGIKNATCSTILLLNSDTELINDAISIAFKKLSENTNIGVVSGKLLGYDGTVQKQCNRKECIKLALIELFRLHKLLSKEKRGKLLQGSYFDYETSLYTDKVWGTFFMFRKSLLSQFPEKKLHDNYFMYGEDVQWCYYIRYKLNKQIFYYPKAKIYHLGGGSMFNENKLNIQLRNRYTTLLTYHSKNYLRILGIIKWLQNKIEELKQVENKRTSAIIWNIFVCSKNKKYE